MTELEVHRSSQTTWLRRQQMRSGIFWATIVSSKIPFKFDDDGKISIEKYSQNETI